MPNPYEQFTQQGPANPYAAFAPTPVAPAPLDLASMGALPMEQMPLPLPEPTTGKTLWDMLKLNAQSVVEVPAMAAHYGGKVAPYVTPFLKATEQNIPGAGELRETVTEWGGERMESAEAARQEFIEERPTGLGATLLGTTYFPEILTKVGTGAVGAGLGIAATAPRVAQALRLTKAGSKAAKAAGPAEDAATALELSAKLDDAVRAEEIVARNVATERIIGEMLPDETERIIKEATELMTGRSPDPGDLGEVAQAMQRARTVPKVPARQQQLLATQPTTREAAQEVAKVRLRQLLDDTAGDLTPKADELAQAEEVLQETVIKPLAREAGVTPPSASKFTEAKDFYKRWLTTYRGLGEEVFNVIEAKNAGIAAAKLGAKDAAEALGNQVDNYLIANPTVDKVAFGQRVRSALSSRNEIEGLPQPIAKTVALMRNEVDNLSGELVDAGMVPEWLADVIVENQGEYMTRTFRAFRDKSWFEKLRASDDWIELKDEMRKLPGNEALDDEAIYGQMEKIAGRVEEAHYSGSGVGTIETGIYKQRKDLPEVIRKVLGEDTDAGTVYYHTVDRLARNIETFRMNQALETLGKAQGWLSDSPLPGIAKKLTGSGTTRNPLGGNFTTEEMKAIIEGTVDQTHLTMFHRIAGYAKWAKTVGSLQAQTRNFESNLLLLMGGGNLGTGLMPWNRGKRGTNAALDLWEGYKNQHRAGGKRIQRAAEKLSLDDARKMRMSALNDEYLEMTELGITGQQIDLQDTNYFLNHDDNVFLQKPAPVTGLKAVGRAAAAPFRALGKLAKWSYRAGDEIPKRVVYRNEQAKYKWALPDLPERDIKIRAAEHVKNIMPTYSRVPMGIQKLRQQPVFANFVSFVSEIPRNVKNNLKIGFSDIAEGHRTGNWKLQALGYHRLASQAAAVSAPQVLKSGIRQARNAANPDAAPSREVEAGVAPLTPPWVNNYILWSVDGDDMTIIDLSSLDPYEQVKGPVYAALASGKIDDSVWDKLGDAAAAFAEPYVSEGVFTGAALDVWRAQKRHGGEVYNRMDPAWIKAVRGASHFGMQMAPGIVTTGAKVAAGAAKVPTGRSGRVYDPQVEAIAMGGPRAYKTNIPNVLSWKAQKFSDAQRSAAVREGIAASDVNAAERELSAESAQSYRRESIKEIVSAARAARYAGKDDRWIADLLDSEGLSRSNAWMIVEGISKSDDPAQFEEWLEEQAVRAEAQSADSRQKRLMKGR